MSSRDIMTTLGQTKAVSSPVSHPQQWSPEDAWPKGKETGHAESDTAPTPVSSQFWEINDAGTYSTRCFSQLLCSIAIIRHCTAG